MSLILPLLTISLSWSMELWAGLAFSISSFVNLLRNKLDFIKIWFLYDKFYFFMLWILTNSSIIGGLRRFNGGFTFFERKFCIWNDVIDKLFTFSWFWWLIWCSIKIVSSKCMLDLVKLCFLSIVLILCLLYKCMFVILGKKYGFLFNFLFLNWNLSALVVCTLNWIF